MDAPNSPWLWILIGGAVVELLLWTGVLFPHEPYEALQYQLHFHEAGFKEVFLDSNLCWTTFASHFHDDAQACTMYRASELTKQHGYNRFIVVDSTEFSFGSLAFETFVISKTFRMLPLRSDSVITSSYNATDQILAIRQLIPFTRDTLK